MGHAIPHRHDALHLGVTQIFADDANDAAHLGLLPSKRHRNRQALPGCRTGIQQFLAALHNARKRGYPPSLTLLQLLLVRISGLSVCATLGTLTHFSHATRSTRASWARSQREGKRAEARMFTRNPANREVLLTTRS